MAHDVFGAKTGQVHMQRQDYSKLQTRKIKGLKRKPESGDLKGRDVSNAKRKK